MCIALEIYAHTHAHTHTITGSHKHATCTSCTVTSCNRRTATSKMDNSLFAHLAWLWSAAERRATVHFHDMCKSSEIWCSIVHGDTNTSGCVWVRGSTGKFDRCLPLGIGAGAWGVLVERTEFANFIQHENNKQNLRYSIAVVVRVPRTECGWPTGPLPPSPKAAVRSSPGGS